MTAVRRLVAVLGLALTVVVGSSLPAAATFSDTATVATTSVATATVAAPGNVTGSLTCGSSNATMKVTWNPSGSPKVSGYRVIVHFSDGYEQSQVVSGATATSWTDTITTFNATKYAIRYSVTTLTTYGWFTQSGLTGSFRC
jgi:hypothetical protein